MPTQTPLDPLQELGLRREALPRHIAIIMDGNGRWAQQRGLERIQGHLHGVESVRDIITHCARLGIGYLTLYSFSSENWRRPKAEVDALMSLCAEHLVKRRGELMENGVRLRQIGSRSELPAEVVRELETTERLSGANPGLTVCLALNYGSRQEIVEAVRALGRRVATGALRPDDIDESSISAALWTAGMPDPDLLIRTAGQMRISNFLLWQISYSELYVTPVLWPDFRNQHLNEAILDYAGRERRYGAVEPAS